MDIAPSENKHTAQYDKYRTRDASNFHIQTFEWQKLDFQEVKKSPLKKISTSAVFHAFSHHASSPNVLLRLYYF